MATTLDTSDRPPQHVTVKSEKQELHTISPKESPKQKFSSFYGNQLTNFQETVPCFQSIMKKG